jgi:hypothetical protein
MMWKTQRIRVSPRDRRGMRGKRNVVKITQGRCNVAEIMRGKHNVAGNYAREA